MELYLLHKKVIKNKISEVCKLLKRNVAFRSGQHREFSCDILNYIGTGASAPTVSGD